MAQKTIYSAAYRDVIFRLRQAREAAGFTQSDLAGKLGWPQQRLSAVESGSRRLDILEFVHLTGALGLDPVAEIRLITPEPDRTPKRSK